MTLVGVDSQSWEGLQGTDSISPPYLLKDNKTWAAFYGSAQTQNAAKMPHNMSWYNGIVTTTKPVATLVILVHAYVYACYNALEDTGVYMFLCGFCCCYFCLKWTLLSPYTINIEIY